MKATVRDLLRRAEELADDAPEDEVLDLFIGIEAAVEALQSAAKDLAKAQQDAGKRWLKATGRDAVWMVDREHPERSVRWRLKPNKTIKHRRDVSTILGDIEATYPDHFGEVLERVLSESPSAWKRAELREAMGEDWEEAMFREEKVKVLAADSPTKKQVAETLAREVVLFFPAKIRERVVRRLRKDYGIPDPESEAA